MYDKIRPKSAKLARAHGLPKIHKLFKNIPSFRPIIDRTCTMHYSVGKYLSELLKPLKHNDYSLKDSLDAATSIRRILPQAVKMTIACLSHWMLLRYSQTCR